MTRQEWLQTFLDLCDRGRPAMEVRKRLGVHFRDLNAHIASIPQYRKELEELKNIQRGLEQLKTKELVGPSEFLKLSEEELNKVPRLTEKEIKSALAEGKKAKDSLKGMNKPRGNF